MVPPDLLEIATEVATSRMEYIGGNAFELPTDIHGKIDRLENCTLDFTTARVEPTEGRTHYLFRAGEEFA